MVVDSSLRLCHFDLGISRVIEKTHTTSLGNRVLSPDGCNCQEINDTRRSKLREEEARLQEAPGMTPVDSDDPC